MSDHELHGRKQPATDKMNLYRLDGIPATVSGLRQAIMPSGPEMNAEVKTFTVAGCPAVRVTAWRIRNRVQWNPVVAAITGEDPELGSLTPDCLLLVAVDDHAYAITFGRGLSLLDPACIESGFGLRFAVRVLDPQRIGALIRNPLTGQGRVDHTRVAGGAAVTAFGILPWGNLIRSFSGRGASGLLPTTGRLSARQPSLTGSDALSIRLGCGPEDLVADIREIAKICELRSPIPELEFATKIRQLGKPADAALITELEQAADQMLGDADSGIEFTIPHRALNVIDDAHAFAVKIGGRRELTTEVDLAAILARIAAVESGRRMAALTAGYIGCFGDEEGLDPLEGAGQIRAVNWITAEIALGADRYVLLEGRWFRVGAEHLEALHAKVTEILARPAPIHLPPWPKGQREEDYVRGEDVRKTPGFVILDQKRVHTRQHPRGIEACDIFVETGQVLVHVKKASASDVLSHLFNQAMVSVDALRNEPDARERFATRVKEESGGSITVDPGFVPVNICLAIKWKDGRPVTAISLPTFAQVALLQLDFVLGGANLTVTSINEV